MSSCIEAALPAATTIIHRTGGLIAGVRELTDDATRLSVLAFPLGQLAEAARFRGLAVPACYILSGEGRVYIGESGNVARRLAEHQADPAKSFARDVFVVSGFDDRWFDKTAAVHFQYALTQAAEAARLATLLKGTNPQSLDLPPWRLTTFRRLIGDAERLLFDAGCRAFHSNDPVRVESSTGIAPQVTLVDSDLTGSDDRDDAGVMHVGVSTTPIGVAEYELLYGSVWARGYAYGEDFVVAAGSEIRVAINPSVNPIVHTRRQELQDNKVLMPIAGIDDRWRLAVAVAFPSPAIAAKIVCGAHVNASRWTLLDHPRPLVIAA